MMRFKDKVAIVTGGLSGIGAATVALFLREGAQVVVADLADAAPSDDVMFVRTDVSQQDQVEHLVAEAIAKFGRIDIVFNSAGIGGMGAATEIDASTWRNVMGVNVDALYYMCHAIIPHMAAKGGGAIVNAASISGFAGDYGMAVYNASKGAVINFTKALAVDHARQNVRVNAVAPGIIDTPLIEGAKAIPGLFDKWVAGVPMKRAGKAEEIAEVVAFLASDAASFMTGSIVVADGGTLAHSGQPDLGAYIAELQANYN